MSKDAKIAELEESVRYWHRTRDEVCYTLNRYVEENGRLKAEITRLRRMLDALITAGAG